MRILSHPVFLLDEAHLLHQDTLDHLHILLNYEWDSRALLSIVLVGLPELGEQLALRRNRSLFSRILRRLNIPPLSPEDSYDYVQFRLTAAGAAREIFTSDAIGLVNMRGRMYDPESGRFLSPDPYVWSTLDSQAGARYSYVRNNPLTYRDPTDFQSTGDPYEVVVRAKRLAPERPKAYDTQRQIELVPTPDVKGNSSIRAGASWRGFREGAAPGIETIALGATLAFLPGSLEVCACLAAASMVNEILPIVANHATGAIDDDEYSRRLGQVVGAATTGVAIGAALAGAQIVFEGVAREVLGHFFRPIPRAGVGELSVAESVEGSLSVAAGGASRVFPGGVDDVIASGTRPSRAGSTTSRAVQALQKKVSNPGKAENFGGLEAGEATANSIIREAFGTQRPVIRTSTNRAGHAVIDVVNPDTGRGVRLLRESGAFDTFVNP